ncbi:hypothetical protein BJX65DRAFT_114706 [Aspergillus insuetus]
MLAIYCIPRLTQTANLQRLAALTTFLTTFNPPFPTRTSTPFQSVLLQPRFPVMDGTSPSPTPGPASTAGTKRKRGSAGKYYAVKSGYQPGVYYEWNECLAQVTGYKGAVCDPSLPYPRRSECIPHRCETPGLARHVSARNRGDAILRDPARTQARRLHQLGQCTRTD